MAGIMGGEAAVSAIKPPSCFSRVPFHARTNGGSLMVCGLHTDASHRYERGVDFQPQRQAMERDAALDAVGGEPGPITEVVARQICRSTSLRFASHKSKNPWVLLSTVSRSSAFSKGSDFGLSLMRTAGYVPHRAGVIWVGGLLIEEPAHHWL